ncbi:MAG: hypothetical protein VB959_17490 [Rhodospirillales bacterium]
MFNFFSKNKGKKAPKPKAKTVKVKGGKKAGAKAKGGKKARAKDELAAAPLEQNSAMPKSQGIFLEDIPTALKHRKKSLDAGKSLEAAKAALQSDEPGNLTPNGRKKLIAQAMAVHKVQSRLLDDLDPETKQRLRALAMQKLILERK